MSRPTIHHLTQTLHRTAYSAIDPASPSNSAAGKRVVISSGATGIGYAIAHSFVTAHAAVVILLAWRAHALDEAADKLRAYAAELNIATAIWTYTLDIRDDAATEAVFEDNQDVDVLVTSAAYFAPHNLSLSFSAETLRESFDTNVLGNMNLAAQPATKATPPAGAKPPTKAKVVLDVSSITTYTVVPGVSAYGASKLAFTRLMAHLQAEVSTALPHIRIHSFHPGAIYTPAMQKTGFAPDFIRWDDESLPAGFAVWLACNEEAAFLKGRFVFAVWDVGEMVAMRERFEKEPGLCRIALDV
ncbi:hypothetical protein BKA80DRAFT_239075 [Phyllosticta citrichinensis]